MLLTLLVLLVCCFTSCAVAVLFFIINQIWSMFCHIGCHNTTAKCSWCKKAHTKPERMRSQNWCGNQANDAQKKTQKKPATTETIPLTWHKKHSQKSFNAHVETQGYQDIWTWIASMKKEDNLKRAIASISLAACRWSLARASALVLGYHHRCSLWVSKVGTFERNQHVQGSGKQVHQQKRAANTQGSPGNLQTQGRPIKVANSCGSIYPA